MSNLSSTDKTNETAISGVLREPTPLQNAAPEIPESSSEEEGEIREEAGHGKRNLSPEEARPAKRIKGPEPDAFSFSSISHVRSRLNCMIGVKDRKPIGSLTALTEDWTVRLFMDPGRFGAPTVTLGFSKDGEKDICRSTWDVDSYVQGEWAMNDLTFSRLHDQDPLFLNVSDQWALRACEPEDRHLLFSMKFVSWKRVIGYNNLVKKSQGQMPKNLRMSLKTIFTPDDSYILTIWFKAPYNVALFQSNCLEHFTRALAARKPPLYMFVDDFGQQFRVSRNERPTKDLASTEYQMILAPKGSGGHYSREKGQPDDSVSSTDDEIEVEPTRQSPDPRLEASQSTPKVRPELPDESRRHERDMEIRHQGQTPTYPQPLPTESQAASVEKGLEEAPATSRTPRDISPNITMESDIGLRPNVLLDLEREDLNVTGHSATPPGNSPRPGSQLESYSSPSNHTPPWMAMLTSDAVLSDLETRPKDSTIPEDQTALTLTTEGSSSAPAIEGFDDGSFGSPLRDRPSQPQQTESWDPSGFMLGLLDLEDGSDEDNGGSNGS